MEGKKKLIKEIIYLAITEKLTPYTKKKGKIYPSMMS